MMKLKHTLSIVLLLFSITCVAQQYQTIAFEPDTVSLIRNPAMGWGLYDDANGHVQDANVYWRKQDEAAKEHATFFYIRWRWSDMEPEEGQYAWEYNENYKTLIKGALDRGLKLYFRVYNNSRDNIAQSTPDYLRKAGAKGYYLEGIGKKEWTPYPDDPIFKEKLATFVEAFAKEYDNPAIVDVVDGYAVGFWGECHHVELLEPAKERDFFDWYTSLYAKNFRNVLLVLPFSSPIGFETEKEIAIDKNGFGIRRDGLGSKWFFKHQRDIAKRMYGKFLFVGESCYWGGASEAHTPFRSDDRFALETWRDVYEATIDDALTYHFNTLDLREIVETKGWTTQAPDLVEKFKTQGGYRIYLSSATLPTSTPVDSTVEITHSWKNIGSGYLPNNMKNWGYKYKPAFALLDKKGCVVKMWVDNNAEPSTWLSGKENRYTLELDIKDVPSGAYHWGVGIVNKKNNNQPEIKLCIKDKKVIDNWVVLKSITIN